MAFRCFLRYQKYVRISTSYARNNCLVSTTHYLQFANKIFSLDACIISVTPRFLYTWNPINHRNSNISTFPRRFGVTFKNTCVRLLMRSLCFTISLVVHELKITFKTLQREPKWPVQEKVFQCNLWYCHQGYLWKL